MNIALAPRLELTIPLLRNGRLHDTIIVSGFLLFAFLLYLGRIQPYYPLVVLGGDAANISGWTAAWDHPESFANDPILSNTDNFSFYQTIHIPLVSALAKLNGGNYSLAFAALLIPSAFLYLLSFYVLGRVLFKDRYWALLLALVNLGYLEVNIGEYWGMYWDAQPRFTFQALIPFALALAVHWRAQPGRWPWLMVFAGSLMYVHPVSAPVWALALWLGLWTFRPLSYSARKRIGYMLLMGVVFLAAGVPFLLGYFQNRPQPTSSNYDEIYPVLQTMYSPEVWDTPLAVKDFIRITLREAILPLSVASLVVIWWLKRDDRSTIKLVVIWGVGLGLGSVGIPYMEQNIERAFKILPVQIDLIRGIRYTIPLMLMLGIWALSEISKRVDGTQVKKTLVAVTGVVLTLLWLHAHPPQVYYLRQAFTCLETGRLVCTLERPTTLELITAVRELTPPTAVIMPFFGESNSLLSIRYAALRSLAFHRKDGVVLSYNMSGQDKLVWIDLSRRFAEVLARNEDGDQLAGLLELSRELGADYVVIIHPEINPETLPAFNLDVIFANESYSLIRL